MHFDRTDEEEHLALPGATSREYMKPFGRCLWLVV